MLVVHIISALTSLIFSAYMYVVPSKAKLAASYGLLGMTLGSGSYLIITTRAHILQSCILGLLYSTGVIYAIVATRYKLARQESENKQS